VALEQDGRCERVRWLRERGRDPSSQLLAAGDTKAQEWEADQEQGRLRERARVGHLASEGQSHRRREVGVHDGADVGAGGMDREMDGQVGGRTETAPGDRVALGVIEPDDDEILGLELILANAGRGDQQPIRVEPDGEVALACRDEASRAQPLAGRDHAVGRACEGVHEHILRRGHRAAGASRTIADMPDEPAAQPLAQNRDFKVLLTSQGVSSLGDAVSFTALPLLVLALTGSGLAMGIVGALQTLPDLFLGMVAGALADRSDRKRMMFLADLGRAGLTALIPLSVALGGPTMAVILVVASPMSILRSFFLAGYTASVPALVGRSQVGRANSYFEAIYSMGYIVGPAIAGLLAAAIGPGPTLAIDAVSFTLSALGLAFVRRDLRAPVDRPRQRLLTEIREGIDFIVAHPTLRTVILFWGATSILMAPLVTAMAVHVTRDLHLAPSILGLILAAYGVGTVIGSLVIARRIGRGRVGETLLGGNLVMGLALLTMAITIDVPVQVGAAFVAGIAQSMVLVTYITLRTAYSPDALLGRIGSTARTISLGLQPVGLLVGGALVDLTSGSATMALMGLCVAAVSLVFAPVAALRRAAIVAR
jgi:MFS family permease